MHHEYLILYHGTYRDDDDDDDEEEDDDDAGGLFIVTSSVTKHLITITITITIITITMRLTHQLINSLNQLIYSLTYRQGHEQESEHVERFLPILMQHLLLEAIYAVHLRGLVVAYRRRRVGRRA